MKHELESLGEQRLQHRHQTFVANALIRSRRDLEVVGVDPIGAAQNAILSNSIGANDAALKCHVHTPEQADGGLAAGWSSKFLGIARVNGGDLELRLGGLHCWSLPDANGGKKGGANGHSKYCGPHVAYDDEG